MAFWKISAACALIAVTALTGCRCLSSTNPTGETNAVSPNLPLAITHGPFLQAPSDRAITICWGTSRKCVSRVEYRPEASPDWLTNTPVHYGLVDADVTYHSIALTGLQPGTRYVYRTVSREIADFKYYRVTFGGTVISAENRFTTLDPQKPATSFVVLNDRHERVPALAASLASVKWTNIDLTFLNGDMVHGVNNEQQLYQCIIDPCAQSFASRIPFIYVRGNHDTRGTFARHLLEYFPTTSGRYYYTLQQGPVCFLVLDCGEDKIDSNTEYYGLVNFEPYMKEQAQWLGRAIEEPAFQNAPFRVCLLHLPPTKKPDPKFIRPQWLMDNVAPLLNQGKVDLLITAHTHRYAVQAAPTNGLNFPMITGGTNTVIRCDATKDEIRVSSTDLSGNTLPQLPVIRRRAKD